MGWCPKLNKSVCCLCFLVFLAITGNCVLIDNEIEGGAGPRVYCFQNGLKLQVETKNPFTGRIYVKGQYNNPQCNRNFTGETKQPGLNVAYSECLHNRERLSPGGMMFTLEIVVQFHPFFTTKIDRGFVVSCSYMEGVNIVTQNQVLQGNIMLPDGSSDSIPVTIVSYAPLMPNCKYTIHRGSPDGPLISFAKVGEKVVHKWQCYPTADGEFHGLLVHNCFARDVRGVTRIQTLDKRGCTLDPFSLPTPTYTLDLTMAYAEVHAFKFADDLQISFACSISLCLRMNGGCVGISPPNCGGEQTTIAGGAGGGYPPTAAAYPPPTVAPAAAYPAPPAAYPTPAAPSYPAPTPAPSYQTTGAPSYPSTPHPPAAYPPPTPAPAGYPATSAPSYPAPAAKPAYAFAKSAPASSVYYPPGYSNSSLSYPPSGPPRGLPAGYEPSPTGKSTSTNSSQNDNSPSISIPMPPVAHFPPDVISRENLFSESIHVEKPSASQSINDTAPWNQMSDVDFENLIRELSPTKPTASVPTESSSNLGIFVGEGVINIQPFKPDNHKVSSDAAAFTNSKRKDSNPVGPDSKPTRHSLKQSKTNKALLGNEQDLRVPKNGLFEDSDAEGVIEASFELEAQDFVVFDKQSPVFSKDAANNTIDVIEYFDDDDEIVRRASGQTICITTFVFTQIIILLAFCFSIIMALAVFFRMRHRRKSSQLVTESRL